MRLLLFACPLSSLPPHAGTTYTIAAPTTNTFTAPLGLFFRPAASIIIGNLTESSLDKATTCTATITNLKMVLPQFTLMCQGGVKIYQGAFAKYDLDTREFMIAVNLVGASSKNPQGIFLSFPGYAVTALYKTSASFSMTAQQLIGSTRSTYTYVLPLKNGGLVSPVCLAQQATDRGLSYYFSSTYVCINQWFFTPKSVQGFHLVYELCTNATTAPASSVVSDRTKWSLSMAATVFSGYISAQVKGTSWYMDDNSVFSAFSPSSTSLISFFGSYANAAGQCASFAPVAGTSSNFTTTARTLLGATADASTCTMTLATTYQASGAVDSCGIRFTFVCGTSEYKGLFYPNTAAASPAGISAAAATAAGAFTTVINVTAGATTYPTVGGTAAGIHQETFTPDSLAKVCALATCAEGCVFLLFIFRDLASLLCVLLSDLSLFWCFFLSWPPCLCLSFNTGHLACRPTSARHAACCPSMDITARPVALAAAVVAVRISDQCPISATHFGFSTINTRVSLCFFHSLFCLFLLSFYRTSYRYSCRRRLARHDDRRGR
jgi:hypothetical protein